METWYKTTSGGNLEKVEVISSTAHYIQIPNRHRKAGKQQVARLSSYECYFPTKREAVEHILVTAQTKKASAERTIEYSKREIAKCNGIIHDCETVLADLTD